MKEALSSREGLRIMRGIRYPHWNKIIFGWGEGGCSVLGQAFGRWTNCECNIWCLREKMIDYVRRENLEEKLQNTQYIRNEWHLIHVLGKVEDYLVDDARVQTEKEFLNSYPPFRRGGYAEVVPYNKDLYLYEDIPTAEEYVEQIRNLFSYELGKWQEWKSLDQPRIMRVKNPVRPRPRRK